MEEETRPLLASSGDDHHRGGPSSSIWPELEIDNDSPALADDIAPQEDSDASAEEEARFEAMMLLPWHKRPSVSWLLPFAFVLAVVLGMSGSPLEYRKLHICCCYHGHNYRL